MVAPVLPYLMREARRQAEDAVRKGANLTPCVRLSLPTKDDSGRCVWSAAFAPDGGCCSAEFVRGIVRRITRAIQDMRPTELVLVFEANGQWFDPDGGRREDPMRCVTVLYEHRNGKAHQHVAPVLDLPGGYRRLGAWGECFAGEPGGPFAGLFQKALAIGAG